MKKSTLIFFLVLLLNITYSQQPYFNQRYNTDVYEVAWNVLETDSGYLVVGGIASTFSLFYNIELMFIDYDGNIVSTKTYGKSLTRFYPGGPGSFIRTIDGGFAMAGSIEDTTGYDLMIYRFDKNGDTLWTRQYGDTAWQAGNQCKQTPDNGFIVIGRTSTTDYPDGDFWLIKTDSLGNMEWDKTYGWQYYEYGLSVDVCTDGGYILAGETTSYGPNAGPFSGNATNKYIVKVDSAGTEQWNVVIGDTFMDCIWNIEQTMDKGYIIGGCISINCTWIDGGSCVGKPNLIKLDSAGNIAWNRTYGPLRYNTALFMVRELPDGNFIAAGQTSDSIYGNRFGSVLKVAANGDSIWYRNHFLLEGNDSWNRFRDIRPTSDGGFIAAGWVGPSSPDTGTQDMWVAKMDSCGCLYAGCDSACQGLVGLDEFEIQNLKFKVYPNPTEGKFNIEIFNEAGGEKQFEINIYDILGRKNTHTCTERPGSIKTDSSAALTIQSKQIEVDISKYPAGVYLIQVWFGYAHHKWNENNYYSTRVVKY